jgi:predicted dehydrogenase
MNQAIHTVDLLVWFLGEPVEVFAWTGRRLAYFHAAQACDTGPDVGHPPLVTVAEATRTLAVVTAIYQSARAGRPVTVPRPTDR